jgi:hypothetical protein
MLRLKLLHLLSLPLILLGQAIQAQEVDIQWWHLLRYEKSWGVIQSQVQTDAFFKSPEGKNNPSLELKANIQAAQNEPEYACYFPARLQYLINKKLISKTPKRSQSEYCKKYDYFLRKLNPEKVGLIFASFYPNDPGSAFGHTLFKVKVRGENNELLHFGANYSATLTTKNPVLYAWKGLTGGFKGEYSLMPYYYKIREYNSFDHRNLWEYQINFSESELSLFVAHLWEMDHAEFDYYYLSQNCSYHLLKFLDAINPKWNLSARLPTFITPTRTLTVLNKTQGVVDEILFRPSQFMQLKTRYNALDKNEKKHTLTSTEEIEKSWKKSIESLSPPSKAKLIDFYMDYLDTRYAGELLLAKNETSKIKDLKHQLLVKRSSLPTLEKLIVPRPKLSPDQGHPERKVSTGYIYREDDLEGALLSYRFSYHDLMDNDQARPQWNTLIMGDVRTLYNTIDKKYRLLDFNLVKAASYPSLFSLLGGLSWSYSLGAKDYRYTPKREIAPYFEGSFGVSLVNSQSWLIQVLLEGVELISKDFIKGHWTEGGGLLRLSYASYFPESYIKMISQLRHRFVLSNKSDDFHTYEFQLTWGFKKKYSIDLKQEFLPGKNLSSSQLNYYF